MVHGVAYAISGEAAIPYLNHRECQQGGYIAKIVDFYSEKGQLRMTPSNPGFIFLGFQENVSK